MVLPSRNEKMNEENLSNDCSVGSRSRSSLRSSSSSSLSSSSRRSVGRSVSFSDDDIEIHMVEKIARKKKDKETLWFTSSEYDTIRTEAQILAAVMTSVGKINDDENTSRGLEQMKAGEQARVQAAKNFVLQKNEEMYSFLASTAVRKAQELALKDAKDAAEYQREVSKESPRLRTHSKKGFLKFLPQRSITGRS